MSERMPVVFVSHGAPDALLNAPDAVASWGDIARLVPEPAAILVVSAHWEADQPTVSLSSKPETIHDFSGFSPKLYSMQYPAPGATELAERVISLLADAGLAAGLDSDRGLDHGAWVPLSAMYPQANVPVTQLSMIRNADPATHYELGRALAPLRDEGVLIVGSGAITHNFAWIEWRADAGHAPSPKAKVFTDWVADRLATRDIPALLDYRTAPYGADSHPAEDHFLPLFVALGAAMDDSPLRYQPQFAYGGLAMDAYLWPASANQI